MKTPYSEAWAAFIKSDRARQLMTLMGSISVYNENKLREAFDSGWNAAREYYASLLPDTSSGIKGKDE